MNKYLLIRRKTIGGANEAVTHASASDSSIIYDSKKVKAFLMF